VVIETDDGVKTYKKRDIAAIKGIKPIILPEPVDENDPEALFLEGLRVASEGSFLHAESLFQKAERKGYLKDNLKEALSIVEDLRKGAIDEDRAEYLFKGLYSLESR